MINKFVFCWSLLMIFFQAEAKKVRFAVDMSGQTISPNGIHLSGDFQTIAGYPGGDWNSATILLNQEADTNIYSIILDLPAFQKYEYKFVNGDLFYEVEFVPVQSRVGYNFIDNRWFYLDSLGNDTTDLGNMIFAGNAPAGKKLLRLKVDMQNVFFNSPQGIHVGGSWQGFDPSKDILYSFITDTFEIIEHLDSNTYEYIFYNGNTTADAETVPTSCSQNGNRTISLTQDTVLSTVCFSDCFVCVPSKVKQLQSTPISVWPNPTTEKTFINSGLPIKNYCLLSSKGELIFADHVSGKMCVEINVRDVSSGIYFIATEFENGTFSKEKILIQH